MISISWSGRGALSAGTRGQRQRPIRQAQDVLRAHTARVFQLTLDAAAGQVDLAEMPTRRS